MPSSKPLNSSSLPLPPSWLWLDSRSWFDYADVLAFPSHVIFQIQKGGSKTKSKMNSLFLHTWLAPGYLMEKQKAPQCGWAWLWLKVKHSLYTQNGLSDLISRENMWELPDTGEPCAWLCCTCCPSGEKKGCNCWVTTGALLLITLAAVSIFPLTHKKPWFSTQTLSCFCPYRACHCWVWTRETHHSSHL